eukprot:g9787.t1
MASGRISGISCTSQAAERSAQIAAGITKILQKGMTAIIVSNNTTTTLGPPLGGAPPDCFRLRQTDQAAQRSAARAFQPSSCAARGGHKKARGPGQFADLGGMPQAEAVAPLPQVVTGPMGEDLRMPPERGEKRRRVSFEGKWCATPGSPRKGQARGQAGTMRGNGRAASASPRPAVQRFSAGSVRLRLSCVCTAALALLAPSNSSLLLGVSASPLDSVLRFLDDMSQELSKEADANEQAAKKKECFCEKHSKEFQAKLKEERDDVIPGLEGELREVVATISGLSSQVPELQKQIGESEVELNSTIALREKEVAEFRSTEAELMNVEEVVGAAIKVLVGKGGSDAEEGKKAEESKEKDVAEALLAVQRVTSQGRHPAWQATAKTLFQLRAGEAQAGTGAATARTPSAAPNSRIVGVLTQMRDNAKQELADLQHQEAANAESYKKLQKSKQKELGTLQTQSLAKEKEFGDAKDREGDLFQELENAKVSLAKTEQALETLVGECETEKKAFAEERKALEEEQAGLDAAVEALQSEEVEESRRKAALLEKERAVEEAKEVEERNMQEELEQKRKKILDAVRKGNHGSGTGKEDAGKAGGNGGVGIEDGMLEDFVKSEIEGGKSSSTGTTKSSSSSSVVGTLHATARGDAASSSMPKSMASTSEPAEVENLVEAEVAGPAAGNSGPPAPSSTSRGQVSNTVKMVQKFSTSAKSAVHAKSGKRARKALLKKHKRHLCPRSRVYKQYDAKKHRFVKRCMREQVSDDNGKAASFLQMRASAKTETAVAAASANSNFAGVITAADDMIAQVKTDQKTHAARKAACEETLRQNKASLKKGQQEVQEKKDHLQLLENKLDKAKKDVLEVKSEKKQISDELAESAAGRAKDNARYLNDYAAQSGISRALVKAIAALQKKAKAVVGKRGKASPLARAISPLKEMKAKTVVDLELLEQKEAEEAKKFEAAQVALQDDLDAVKDELADVKAVKSRVEAELEETKKQLSFMEKGQGLLEQEKEDLAKTCQKAVLAIYDAKTEERKNEVEGLEAVKRILSGPEADEDREAYGDLESTAAQVMGSTADGLDEDGVPLDRLAYSSLTAEEQVKVLVSEMERNSTENKNNIEEISSEAASEKFEKFEREAKSVLKMVKIPSAKEYRQLEYKAAMKYEAERKFRILAQLATEDAKLVASRRHEVKLLNELEAVAASYTKRVENARRELRRAQRIDALSKADEYIKEKQWLLETKLNLIHQQEGIVGNKRALKENEKLKQEMEMLREDVENEALGDLKAVVHEAHIPFANLLIHHHPRILNAQTESGFFAPLTMETPHDELKSALRKSLERTASGPLATSSGSLAGDEKRPAGKRRSRSAVNARRGDSGIHQLVSDQQERARHLFSPKSRKFLNGRSESPSKTTPSRPPMTYQLSRGSTSIRDSRDKERAAKHQKKLKITPWLSATGMDLARMEKGRDHAGRTTLDLANELRLVIPAVKAAHTREMKVQGAINRIRSQQDRHMKDALNRDETKYSLHIRKLLHEWKRELTKLHANVSQMEVLENELLLKTGKYEKVILERHKSSMLYGIIEK